VNVASFGLGLPAEVQTLSGRTVCGAADDEAAVTRW
jgi:hypothetical protein